MIPEIELKQPEEIKNFQEKKLQELLQYVNEHSPFYKNWFNTHNVAVASIKTLEDLRKIPVITKKEVFNHNAEFLCVPKSQIRDYVTTSGTTGSPVFFGLTENDLERLAYNEAISFACSGVTAQDTIQLMTTVDRRFLAGLAYVLGARKLEASMIRVGAGIPELQWDSIAKFKPTYLIAVPSFLLKMIAYAEQHGIAINESSVKGVICIGEPLKDQDFSPNALSKKIQEKWDIKLFSTYASTEMSTAFSECEYQQGGHHHPELIVTEIVDENNMQVAPGQEGELVITTLGIEGMPLVRFKTGDIVKAHTSPCACGRNTMRLGPVIGRKNQMIKYKGTTLFPPAMYNLINNFSAIENYVILLTRTEEGMDNITIKVGMKHPDQVVLKQLKDHIRAKLRVLPTVELCDVKEVQALKFPNNSRKPQLFIDKRANDNQ